jgi:hypothetical protein
VAAVAAAAEAVPLICGMASREAAGTSTASTMYTVLLQTSKLPRMLAVLLG